MRLKSFVVSAVASLATLGAIAPAQAQSQQVREAQFVVAMNNLLVGLGSPFANSDLSPWTPVGYNYCQNRSLGMSLEESIILSIAELHDLGYTQEQIDELVDPFSAAFTAAQYTLCPQYLEN